MDKTSNIKFSIIVPMYNVEKYIGECIESVIAQTYTNWELILVDDETKDGSVAIAQRYADRNSRIKIIKIKHAGLPNARNAGLDVIQGDYVVLLDGDDYLAPDHLSKTAPILDKYRCEMCISNNHINFTKTSQDRVELFPFNEGMNDFSLEESLCVIFAKENRLPAAAWLTVYSREFLTNNNLRYTGEYICSEDLDFFLNCISKVRNIKFSGHEFYFYRQDNLQALTKNMSKEMYLHRMSIYEKWFRFYDRNAYFGENGKLICNVLRNDFRENIIQLNRKYYRDLKTYIRATHRIWGKYKLQTLNFANLYLNRCRKDIDYLVRRLKFHILKIVRR